MVLLTREEFYQEAVVLYNSIYDKRYKQIRRIFANTQDADDALQCAFERLLTFWYAYDSEQGDLEGWFNGILKNCIYQTLIFYRRQGVVFDEPQHAEVINPAYEDFITYDEIVGRINNEPANHRVVLRCRFVHEFSLKDVAILTGVKEENVKKILYRFRQRMKKIYGHYLV